MRLTALAATEAIVVQTEDDAEVPEIVDEVLEEMFGALQDKVRL
jgi:hypothetical protein